ncbi:MAG TPA: DNA-binding domain-containing protein [Usitatibacter sp.]|nr:DNA-binding domain-containing protein [Usitatibacter sp.]
MTELATLQRRFMREVLGEEEPATPGLRVYRASILANCAGALAATYPVVRRLVGEAFLTEAARRYALAQPSSSGDLGEYGEGFASFLETYPHAASLPYLPDVARLEWACHECERADEPAPFDFAALARVPAALHGELRLRLHPALRLLRSAYPVSAIHAANAPDRDGVPDRVAGIDFVVVRRAGSIAQVQSVPVGEWNFLQALARADTLDVASREVPAEFLEGALARYVALGVVCGFTAPRCAP